MKEFIDKVRELWTIKRYRAIIVLVIYFIFFGFVAATLNDRSSIPVEELTGLELFQTATKYKYKINDISCNYNKICNYNGSDYSFEELDLGIDISIYTPTNIYKLIKGGILESTNYITKANTYNISSKNYNKIIYNTNVDSEYDIKIITYGDNINKVEVYIPDYTLIVEVEY